MNAQGCFMTVGSFGNFVAVLRPEVPEDQIGSLRVGKVGESVNPAVFPNPVSRLYMIGMRLLVEARAHGLLCRKEARLRLGYLVEPPRCLFIRPWHCTIPQLS